MPARPGLFLTVLAAVIAGFGLGTLALALARPVPESAPLPPPHTAPAEPGQADATALPEDGEHRPPVWPAAFGEPPPPAPPPPDPEPEPEPPPAPRERAPPRPPSYALRGVITDADGGWVLAEAGEGIELVRLGEQLSGGERVSAITAQGVVLARNGEHFLITFDEQTATRLDPADVPTEAEEGVGSRDGAQP